MDANSQSDRLSPSFPAGVLRLSVLCHRCGYNLRGCDPAGACPECGAPIWPSLRPFVDTSDERLALLRSPVRLGASLMTISIAMLLSAIALWWPYLRAMWTQLKSPGAPLIADVPVWPNAVVFVLAFGAMAATFGLRQPTGATAPKEYRTGLRLARAGLLVWALLQLLVLWHDTSSQRSAREWYDLVQVDAVRSTLRLALDATALLMVAGFRPVVKFLSQRSAPHRAGGASRQGFLAMLVALVAIICGDLLRLASWSVGALGFAGLIVDNAALIGTMVVLIGSAMMTLALLNLAIDSGRLARNLSRRQYRIEEVIG